MVGDIKAIRPCVKSASAKLFLDLHTVSAPSGEERTLDYAFFMLIFVCKTRQRYHASSLLPPPT